MVKALIPYGLICLWRIYQNKKNTVKKDEFVWEMSINERELYKKYIASAKIYLEFGSGGSTIAALINTEGKIYSVESSKEWIDQMNRSYKIITESKKSGRLALIHANIGPTGGWGIPINENSKSELFLKYSQEVFEKYPDAKLSDVVLIDGRFRVACFLNTLLNTKLDTIIMIHDFWNRANYHIIKNFINIVDGADTLMICKRNGNIPYDKIMQEYDNYKYNSE